MIPSWLLHSPEKIRRPRESWRSLAAPAACFRGLVGSLVLILTASAASGAALSAQLYRAAQVTPPSPQREFRGIWVATVKNIDWPSRPGLPTELQKGELLAILDRAVQLNLNAIILQVRPACDAFYASTLEPWSEYLTGRMGQAPNPFYDPLMFAVAEAHKRGLELHAWFNPYRARHPAGLSPISPNHVSRTHPGLVRTYGKHLWLDPGEPSVQDHSLRVILDVVHRYDIDGVHFDDYFYPYRETDAQGRTIDFPDRASWERYQKAGGDLLRDDWRRNNVNRFIARTYAAIKAVKPWVKFGVSPFGIWRPGYPAQIRGYDPYEQLYADSRRWLGNGWLDYLTPQLYWGLQPKEQSFSTLLRWWTEQNRSARHIWPGSNLYRVGSSWKTDEILNQIRFTRNLPGANGNVFWSTKPLLQNKGGIATQLARTVYAESALVPASPWLDKSNPTKPLLTVEAGSTALTFLWEPQGREQAWLWLVQMRRGQSWSTKIIPGKQSGFHVQLAAGLPEVFSVRAIDRCGNASPAAVLGQASGR